MHCASQHEDQQANSANRPTNDMAGHTQREFASNGRQRTVGNTLPLSVTSGETKYLWSYGLMALYKSDYYYYYYYKSK